MTVEQKEDSEYLVSSIKQKIKKELFDAQNKENRIMDTTQSEMNSRGLLVAT